MVHKILAGFFAEGPTDHRFLGAVVKRTLENIALEFNDTVEILDVTRLDSSAAGFSAQVVDVARQAWLTYGISIVCVHTDADHRSDAVAWANKFAPALDAITSAANVCKIIVPVLPVQMMEAWMLADVELLKRQIGSQKSRQELGLHRPPESIADPKRVIEDAIRVAREDMPRRRRTELTRSDLYQPIGSAISLAELTSLASYRKFCQGVRQAYRTLNIY